MLVEKNESKPEDRASPILLSFEFENVDGDPGGLWKTYTTLSELFGINRRGEVETLKLWNCEILKFWIFFDIVNMRIDKFGRSKGMKLVPRKSLKENKQ